MDGEVQVEAIESESLDSVRTEGEGEDEDGRYYRAVVEDVEVLIYPPSFYLYEDEVYSLALAAVSFDCCGERLSKSGWTCARADGHVGRHVDASITLMVGRARIKLVVRKIWGERA